jgi:hypothetical protein
LELHRRALAITVRRARLPAAVGRTEEWRSAVLPRYTRMTRQAEALIAATQTDLSLLKKVVYLFDNGRLIRCQKCFP